MTTPSSTETVLWLNPNTITVRKGWNCRDFSDPENKAHVEGLVESIRANGVLEPLTIVQEGGKNVLVNGESRLRAIKILAKDGHEVETVPVRVVAPETSEPEKLMEQVLRNSGKPYTVLEQCAVFMRLQEMGWEDKEIARHAGMTLERVRQILRLENATDGVRKRILKGQISATVVQRLIAESDDPAEVEDRVVAAITRAKAEGKDKAGPRHVIPKDRPPPEPEPEPAATEQGEMPLPPGRDQVLRISAKQLLSELLEHQKGQARGNGDSVTVTFEIPRDRWAKISKSGY